MKIGRRLLPDLAQIDLFAGKPALAAGKPAVTGEALMVRVDLIDEDPGNPRTEFLEADIHELAEDIRQQGLLQPIVVQAASAAGRYRIRFGAMRLRAAVMAGLTEVPVTVCTRELDAYAQVAENQKRRGLSALDLARFIRSRVSMGESNAQIVLADLPFVDVLFLVTMRRAGGRWRLSAATQLTWPQTWKLNTSTGLRRGNLAGDAPPGAGSSRTGHLAGLVAPPAAVWLASRRHFRTGGAKSRRSIVAVEERPHNHASSRCFSKQLDAPVPSWTACR
ncbi:MAG: ParB/RepB/Spo0J family partition protein [Burkholderiales bacterium]|nr:ParB/RepB/Spo0J family partition protein [Burkholderiales bacterium]MBP6675396.1 ParB/RepB/Spo0J family partition protein [Vitreoscilla sp.]